MEYIILEEEVMLHSIVMTPRGVGTVVYMYNADAAEVEFNTPDGTTTETVSIEDMDVIKLVE